MSALKTSFNLAAIMEAKAEKALGDNFEDAGSLAQRLAVAKSLDKTSVYVSLGALHNVGNIGNTKSFADFRGKLMEAFPDLTDCRTKIFGPTSPWSDTAIVELCLKKPPAPSTSCG